MSRDHLEKITRNLEIARRWRQGEGATALAKRFGVSRGRIYEILGQRGVTAPFERQPRHSPVPPLKQGPLPPILRRRRP